MSEDRARLVLKLNKIQKTLNAPKNRFNAFGKYKYRSCEDILEAVKKIMPDDCCLTLSDGIAEIGGRIYVKATAEFSDGKSIIASYGFAREPEDKKGMDSAQITGTCSSYSRKYALNGLFLIDDSKDSDSDDKEELETIQLLALTDLIARAKYDVKKILARYGVEALNYLSLSQYEDAMKGLKQYIESRGL